MQFPGNNYTLVALKELTCPAVRVAVALSRYGKQFATKCSNTLGRTVQRDASAHTAAIPSTVTSASPSAACGYRAFESRTGLEDYCDRVDRGAGADRGEQYR